MKRLKLYEQVDRTGDDLRYTWIFDAPYRMRSQLPGWKWYKGHGGPGCYMTELPSLAMEAALRHGLKIGTNGTHAVHDAPMSIWARSV